MFDKMFVTKTSVSLEGLEKPKSPEQTQVHIVKNSQMLDPQLHSASIFTRDLAGIEGIADESIDNF